MKRLLKAVLRIGLLFFILVNIFVIMHAYKFTHFVTGHSRLIRSTTQLSRPEKIRSLIFGVDLPRPVQRQVPAYSYRQVRIASNATLDAWLTDVPDARGTILLCHGYGGEKSSLNNYAQQFQKMGYNTLQLDFMGAGASSDNIVTIGYKEAENVKDAFTYLQSEGYTNITGYGVSMGGVALLKAYSDHRLPFQGFIIECPFGSMVGTVKARFDIIGAPAFPMAHLLTFWGGTINGFNAFSHNSVDYARNVDIPVMLLSGAKDEYVTLQEIDDIYNNLAGRKMKYILPEAKHENYISRFGPEWLREVSPFLKGLSVGAQP